MTNKKILNDGKVRLTWDDFSITVEELPRKPAKQQLRRLSVNTRYVVSTMWINDFIPDNIMMNVAKVLDERDSYDEVVTWILGEVAKLHKAHPEAERIHAVSVHRAEQHFTKVVPEGVEPLQVTCADFVLEVSWTKFSAYSPNSDFQLSDPHYTQIHETSAAAARKLYKLAQAKRDELAKLSWGAFSEWLRAQKVAFEYSFSQWTLTRDA